MTPIPSPARDPGVRDNRWGLIYLLMIYRWYSDDDLGLFFVEIYRFFYFCTHSIREVQSFCILGIHREVSLFSSDFGILPSSTGFHLFASSVERSISSSFRWETRHSVPRYISVFISLESCAIFGDDKSPITYIVGHDDFFFGVLRLVGGGTFCIRASR